MNRDPEQYWFAAAVPPSLYRASSRVLHKVTRNYFPSAEQLAEGYVPLTKGSFVMVYSGLDITMNTDYYYGSICDEAGQPDSRRYSSSKDKISKVCIQQFRRTQVSPEQARTHQVCTGSDTDHVDKEDDDGDDDNDGNKDIDVASSEEDAIREDLVWFSMANEGLQEELRVTNLEVAHVKLELEANTRLQEELRVANSHLKLALEANAGLQEELRVANSEIAHLQLELEEEDERMMTMHQQLELEEEDDNDANENDSLDADDENDAEVDAAVNRLLYKLFDRMYNGTIRGDTNVALAGKVGSIVLKRKDFPYLQRKKIPTLVTEFFQNLDQHEQGLDRDYTIAIPLEKFLYDLRDNIEDMLCDQSSCRRSCISRCSSSRRYCDAVYRGLDSSRDTVEEVTTAVRCFSQYLLTARGGIEEEYPIMCVHQILRDGYRSRTQSFSNTKAVFFVHVLAQLAIEFHSFEEHERGGLLIDDGDGREVLKYLVRSNEDDDEEHHRQADILFLEELIRLHQMDLFKKEDIQRYSLVAESCTITRTYFPERRFRFLVQLDPYSLLQVSPDTGFLHLPLHSAAVHCYVSMKRFRSVFDAGMQYFPYQNGIALLFRKNQSGTTPFQYACGDKNERRQEVMDVVDDTISRYSETTPINTEDALILAATDDAIHLDCVFFLLKRQPDVFLSLLRQQPQQPQTNTDSTKNNSKRSRSNRKSKRKRN